jgi:hypothetical protein
MTAPGMARIARWSIAHRWLVVAGWVLLVVVGGLTAARSGSRLSFTFDLPASPRTRRIRRSPTRSDPAEMSRRW